MGKALSGLTKVVTIGRWSLYGGKNEWDKALSGLTKVERWPYYRVAIIDRFHCIYTLPLFLLPTSPL